MLMFDGVSVVCVILLVCMGEVFFFYGLCYVIGDFINGEVFIDLRDFFSVGLIYIYFGGLGV